MTPSNAQLRQFIMQAFSDEELETLCFDYFPEVQQNFTDGMTKNRKALALISYCDSRGRREDLLATLQQVRPSYWEALVESGSDTGAASQADNSSSALATGSLLHEKTGIELVRVPAGPFQFGLTEMTKTVMLPEFWIGRYQVTNEQFAEFVEKTGYHTIAEQQGKGYARIPRHGGWEWVEGADWQHPHGPDSDIQGKADHPVVQMSWFDAQAFCEWAGLRLPSEQEWEKAARGNKDDRAWPWGRDWIDDACNTREYGRVSPGGTTPVGRYSPQGDSLFGCADMIGNVWEWTDSWYDNDRDRHVQCGGSWSADHWYARLGMRSNSRPEDRYSNFGFRVAATAVTGS